MRVGLWWEEPDMRDGLWWEEPDMRDGLWQEPDMRDGLWWEEPFKRETIVVYMHPCCIGLEWFHCIIITAFMIKG